MTPDNEIAIEPPAERVGRELSRWFGNSDFATRPKDVEALRGTGNHIDWAPRAALFGHARGLPGRHLGGLQLGGTQRHGSAVSGAHVRHHRLLPSLLLASQLQDLARVGQFIFGVLGASAVQRGPIWWAAHHRHHHVHSDKPDDVHSPVQHGFFWSHMGWFMSEKHFAADLSRVKDLLKYPELRFLDRFDIAIPTLLGIGVFTLGVVLKHVAPGLHTSGGQMLVWGFFISTVLVYHGTYTINSLSHVFGRQRYKTGDASRNNPWLALITLGEGWHNNHHHYPASVRQGFYWWEFDITFYALKLMSWVGIIWDLKAVPAAVREGGAKRL